MASAVRKNIDELMQNPARHFDRAEEVLRRHSLSPAQKEKILESWKLDEKRLEASFDENMTGGEESRLGEVAGALAKLKSSPAYQNFGKMNGAGAAELVGGAAGAVFGMALLPMLGGRSTPAARGLSGVLLAIVGAIAGAALACLRTNLRTRATDKQVQA